RSVINFPRLLEIEAAGPVSGARAKTVYRGSILPQMGLGWRLSPDLPTASISLPGELTTRVLIHQRGYASPRTMARRIHADGSTRASSVHRGERWRPSASPVTISNPVPFAARSNR